jgi:hypothetical protein
LLATLTFPGCGGILEKAAAEPTDVPGLFPDTGGAFSPALLALAAASDLELILIIIIAKLFLNKLRIITN